MTVDALAIENLTFGDNPPAVLFWVAGVAKPAGSKKAFKHRHTGKIVVVDDSERDS